MSKLIGSCKSIVTLLLIISLVFAYLPALASETYGSNDGVFVRGYPVKVAGQLVFVNKSKGKYSSIQENTQAIQEDLDSDLLSVKDPRPADVSIKYYDKVPYITLGGYKVLAIDEDNAKAHSTTVDELAQNWQLALQQALGNKEKLHAYILSLSKANQGDAKNETVANSANSTSNASKKPVNYKSRVVFANQGIVMVCKLKTALSSSINQEGDPVECVVTKEVDNEFGKIPKDSVLYGDIEASQSGRMMSRGGKLSVKFNCIKLPNGEQYPISAHLVGQADKYDTSDDANGTVNGENWKSKAKKMAIMGLVGLAAGAALGTGIGAASGMSLAAAGTGAVSGATFGGMAGAGGGMLMRHGSNVELKSGSELNVQLDEPLQVAGNKSNTY